MSTVLRWITAALLAYVLLIALLWWSQERLIFMPTRLASEHLFNLGADVHEVTVEVPGAHLHALHLRHREPRGIVFFLHGNAGNLATWFVDARIYRELGLDLFMLDYRGYGKSSGQISSEEQLHADVRAAWDSIAGRYCDKPAIFLGRSLGTGLAARLAADLPATERPRAVVLVSPYESLQALAREHYPFVPSAVLRYPLRTDLALPKLDPRATAVWLVHGTQDPLIGDHHSAALQAVQGKASWIRIADGGHNDLQNFGAYHEAVNQAFRTALASEGAPSCKRPL